MDEPLASLDTAGKKIAADLIAAHCARGGIAVVATHEALGIECARIQIPPPLAGGDNSLERSESELGDG
jgi:heme exporter protein A